MPLPERPLSGLWGADADVIRKRYETDCADERQRSKSPEVTDNFNEHLEDEHVCVSLNLDFYQVHHNHLQIFRCVPPILC